MKVKLGCGNSIHSFKFIRRIVSQRRLDTLIIVEEIDVYPLPTHIRNFHLKTLTICDLNSSIFSEK